MHFMNKNLSKQEIWEETISKTKKDPLLLQILGPQVKTIRSTTHLANLVIYYNTI